MAAAASCSHWWHAPIYFTLSLLLAFIAISFALHSPSSNNATTPPTMPIRHHHLPLNTSRALQRSGFNIIASLILISPEIFLSSPNSTIFAIKDSALTNSSLPPPWLLKHLLQYHTSPLRLSMSDLLKKPQGACFPTLLHSKCIAVTNVDAKERLVEINNVLVSHPDVFLDERVAVHGILEPFFSLGSQDLYGNWDSIQAPVCDADYSLVSDVNETKKVIEWNKIIRLLSSNGFVSFAIGLNSILDGILEDFPNLSSVTIFTPPDLAFVASPSPVLDKIVRSHILPRRVTFAELSSLPDKTLLRTLLPDQNLEITGGVVNVTHELALNGVEITAPEIFSSTKFIVHEISQAFEMVELPNASR